MYKICKNYDFEKQNGSAIAVFWSPARDANNIKI